MGGLEHVSYIPCNNVFFAESIILVQLIIERSFCGSTAESSSYFLLLDAAITSQDDSSLRRKVTPVPNVCHSTPVGAASAANHIPCLSFRRSRATEKSHTMFESTLK